MKYAGFWQRPRSRSLTVASKQTNLQRNWFFFEIVVDGANKETRFAFHIFPSLTQQVPRHILA
jgi:hypothetical protein